MTYQPTPQQLRDLGDSVLGDLRWIDTANLQHADDGTLRELSARLRRLLVDGGGTLQRYRRAIGLRGEPRVSFTDFPVDEMATFSQSAGARRAGGIVGGLQFFNRALTPEEIEAHYEQGKGMNARHLPLSKWLNGRCMTISGVAVTRRDVINYVANKLGGVHLDHARNAKTAPGFIALDAARSTFRVGDQDAAYAELTAIGQQFGESAEVRDLL